MNSIRVLVRVLGIALLILMIIFPPWKISYTEGPEDTPVSASLGYRPLWFRFEVPEDDPRSNVAQRIDIWRLALQLGGVLVLTNVGLLIVRRPEQ